MPRIKVNPITGYRLTLLPATRQQPEPFGWIQLRNGSSDAGYIYLDSASSDPHLSANDSYIVTQMPMQELDVLLFVLRGERNLQIRFFDPQTVGVSPSVFIEPAPSTAAEPVEFPDVPAEIIAQAQDRRRL